MAAAYEFLRRTEHVLQMENGLQTHTVPEDADKLALLASRMDFAGGGDFERDLEAHTTNVSRTFARVFGEFAIADPVDMEITEVPNAVDRTRSYVLASIEQSKLNYPPSEGDCGVFERLTEVSPHFATMRAANPQLSSEFPDPEADFA